MEKIDLYKEYHKSPNNYPGESYEQNHEQVLKLAKDFGCVSFMDYGCGKGEQWKNENFLKDLGNKPFLYDPAIPKFNKLPPYNFDMIISTDVFEHIPVNEISNCLDWIYKHAKKCVYLGICTKRAKAKLPNGENAHCSVYPHDWWKEQILIHSSKTFVTTVLTTYPPHDHSRLERF